MSPTTAKLCETQVHSIPDIISGYLLGGCLLGFWLTFGSAVDAFIVGNPMVRRDRRSLSDREYFCRMSPSTCRCHTTAVSQKRLAVDARRIVDTACAPEGSCRRPSPHGTTSLVEEHRWESSRMVASPLAESGSSPLSKSRAPDRGKTLYPMSPPSRCTFFSPSATPWVLFGCRRRGWPC